MAVIFMMAALSFSRMSSCSLGKSRSPLMTRSRPFREMRAAVASISPFPVRRSYPGVLMSVAVPDLFIDLSVCELDRGSITVLDARMGTLHLSVSGLTYCDGLVDLRAAFSELPADTEPGGHLIGAQAAV